MCSRSSSLMNGFQCSLIESSIINTTHYICLFLWLTVGEKKCGSAESGMWLLIIDIFVWIDLKNYISVACFFLVIKNILCEFLDWTLLWWTHLKKLLRTRLEDWWRLLYSHPETWLKEERRWSATEESLIPWWYVTPNGTDVIIR